MRLVEDSGALRIEADDGRLAGRYVFDDPFKPYLHPLMTPGGLGMSCFMPHDHKHHRALMYALRTPDINFWEERVTLPEEVVGRQRHVAIESMMREGLEVGFTQYLSWAALDGRLTTFDERRRITCRLAPNGAAYSWTWDTELTALRNTTLVMSQWSAAKPNGAKVNYHGLGLRLPREFGGMVADIVVRVNGREVPVAEAMGATPGEVEIGGALDGFWPVRCGKVRIAQDQANALFIMKDPFAFLSLGPSNLAAKPITRGSVIRERYSLDVSDIATSHSSDAEAAGRSSRSLHYADASQGLVVSNKGRE